MTSRNSVRNSTSIVKRHALLSCGVALCLASPAWCQQSTSTSVSSTPAVADSSFYGSNPAPAPAACPDGVAEATLSAELTQGPYYVEEDLLRSNVTEDQGGLPFEIRITILDTSCNPIAGAFVDIWHCNATGIYSGYSASSQGRRLLQTGNDPSTFLRGTVLTDSNGVATFYSIFPGWYTGRAVHVHTMVHMPEDTLTTNTEDDMYANSSYVAHTGQFFFENSDVTPVYALYPYSLHTGTVMSLEEDGVYAGDERTIFTFASVNPNDLTAGLIGSAVQIVNTTAHYETGFTIPGMQGGIIGFAGAPGMSGMGGPGGFSGGQNPMENITQMGTGLPTLPQATGRKLLQALE